MNIDTRVTQPSTLGERKFVKHRQGFREDCRARFALGMAKTRLPLAEERELFSDKYPGMVLDSASADGGSGRGLRLHAAQEN